jgi:hypothetical protein
MDAPQNGKNWWDVWGQVVSSITTLIGLATAALGLLKAKTESEKREKRLHLRRKKNRFVRCVLKLAGRDDGGSGRP